MGGSGQVGSFAATNRPPPWYDQRCGAVSKKNERRLLGTCARPAMFEWPKWMKTIALLLGTKVPLMLMPGSLVGGATGASTGATGAASRPALGGPASAVGGPPLPGEPAVAAG